MSKKDYLSIFLHLLPLSLLPGFFFAFLLGLITDNMKLLVVVGPSLAVLISIVTTLLGGRKLHSWFHKPVFSSKLKKVSWVLLFSGIILLIALIIIQIRRNS